MDDHDRRAADLSRAAPDAAAGLTDTDRARLARFRAHLAARGRVGVPMVEDFASFGSPATLSRLRPALAAVAPHGVGPLRLACAELRRRAGRPSRARGGERGPERTLSLREDELPEPWRCELDAMRRARARIDAGRRLRGRDVPPPAASMIGDVAYTLRTPAQVCIERGHAIELPRRTVAWWIEAARGRGIRPASVGMQLRALRAFLLWTGEKKGLARELVALAAGEARVAGRMRNRKEERLLATRASIASVWAAAEEARSLPPGSRTRVRVLLEAAALALGVVAPLRIEDLHGPVLGDELTRDAEGWRLELITSKSAEDYDRDLWPELTPFLDAVLEAAAPGGDLWAGYDMRIGTPLFSLDGGRTVLSSDWFSDVFEKRIGHGAHIVRTLWHDHVALNGGADEVWVALAPCGQRDARTERHYRTRAGRIERGAQDRALRRRARQGTAI